MGPLAQVSQACFPVSWEKYPRYRGLLSCVGQRHMLLNPLGYKVARLKRIYCLVRRWKEKSMRGSLKYVPSRKILKFSHSLIRGSDGHR